MGADGEVTYSVTFINRSSELGDACLYQVQDEVPQAFSLAWMSRNTHPGTEVYFNCPQDYSFVWGETGLLVPGVIFDAAQQSFADPAGENIITFTKSGGNYSLVDLSWGPSPGPLTVECDGTISMNDASVGVGMSGSGVFVAQAMPNSTVKFPVARRYFITFGNYKQGEVLDLESITNTAEISFPSGVYSRTVVLNPNLTLAVYP